MSANLHPLFAALLQPFAPPVVAHDTRVERCEGEGAYGYEARCLTCGWGVWRRIFDHAADAGRDHENGWEVER